MLLNNLDKNEEKNEEKKQINIMGQNNRYQIKKLTTDKTIALRKNLPKIQDMSFEKQKSIINILYNKINSNENEIYITEIKQKISGYKQQDILKKVLNIENFVTFDYVLEKLFESKLECYYCSQHIYILYERVRELLQWSLDRINNDIGHNKDNVVIACLNCNLKRRNRSKDSFMFTQNLKITRELYDTSKSEPV